MQSYYFEKNQKTLLTKHGDYDIIYAVGRDTVGLAQLVSASGCGPEGRGFESHISPQIIPNADAFGILLFIDLKGEAYATR